MLTTGYPRRSRPWSGTFVATLWNEVQRQGVGVEVIAPVSVPRDAEPLERGVGLRAIHPRYVSPGVTAPFLRSRRRLSHHGWTRAARSVVARRPLPDWFFGQFLQPAGEAAAAFGVEFQRPSFVEISESETQRWFAAKSSALLRKELDLFTGIVTVSDELTQLVHDDFGVASDRILTLRNGVDHSLFRPGDSTDMRARLGLPSDAVISVTVARYVEAKGVQVAADALATVNGTAGLFIGTGPKPPEGPAVLRAMAVPHDEVRNYLQAADVFLAPSLAEGCSNAVLEAMAVGLPLVLSDRPFMREIADESFAIFVDPKRSDDVAAAIRTLSTNPQKRAEMGARALEASAEFTISSRASRLLEWVSQWT